MLPKLKHPPNLHFNSLNYFLAARGLAFREFKHLFIVNKFVQCLLLALDGLLELSYSLETALHSGIIEIKTLLFQASLNFLEAIFEFLYSFLRLDSFNGLWPVNFLFDFGSHKGNGFVIIHKLHALLHFKIFFFFISLVECFQNFLDPVQS